MKLNKIIKGKKSGEDWASQKKNPFIIDAKDFQNDNDD